MIPGTPYTTLKLSHIFDGSPEAVAAVLATLTAIGRVKTSLPECGRHRDRREERRIYWIPSLERTDVAQRRTGPAEVAGVLTGYDLTRFQRLCMTTRKS
jgi:hypothetical protein